MSENDWTKSICDRLKPILKERSLECESLQKIPYSQEIVKYSDKWEPEFENPICFETDLVIYEINNGNIIPRVIIEAKLGRVSTHDAITYSYKAEKHKNITPHLRYGIMIGEREHYSLPGRLFRHGTNFDFMFCFVGTEPSKEEWCAFIDMILKEVDYSQLMDEMLHNNRSKNRKHYYMLQKQLVLKEL